MTGRNLDIPTLQGFGRHLAASFMRPTIQKDSGLFVDGPEYVMQDLQKLTFKDEFEKVVGFTKEWLGTKAIVEFDRLAGNAFTPREDAVFHRLLREKLAVDPEGSHIEGVRGTTIVGGRIVGMRLNTRGIPVNAYWPIYAGESEERIRGLTSAVDPLPEGAVSPPLSALNTRIANVAAIAGADAVVDLLDGGTGAAVIQGRSGAQPADPDTTVSGTLLFTLVCSDPAFGAAADANPGGRATASSITDDSSADATGTLGYCRASSTNDGATPLDDLIDGEAGTSSADFIFNTLSITAGATVSMSSWTVTLPES